MYQIRYEDFSESYPKFRSYKLVQGHAIQQYIYHKDLKEILWYTTKYPKYKHFFLLDESRFSFSRYDIFEHREDKFSIKDLQTLIQKKFDMQKHKHGLSGEKLTSYYDTVYVNGEEKKFLIGEQGDIFFRLYMVYIQKKVLNTFNSVYGNTLTNPNISIVPQSFYTLMFLRNTLQKENFVLMYITDNVCKIIKEQHGFYQQVESINMGVNALKQMYQDNDIITYRNKSYDEIESNTLAKSLVVQTIKFYVGLLNKWMYEKNLTGTDIIVVSPLIQNSHFLEVFNQEYSRYNNNYVVPFHYSKQIKDYGQKRESDDINTLIFINQKSYLDKILDD